MPPPTTTAPAWWNSPCSGRRDFTVASTVPKKRRRKPAGGATPAFSPTLDARGAGKLIIDGVLGMTDLVEAMHHNILRVPGVFGTATDEPTNGVTGLVYRSIRGVTRMTGNTMDFALGQLSRLPFSPDQQGSASRDAIVSAVNGVLGDHLAASGNPLSIAMQFRQHGRALELTPKSLAANIERPTSRILLLIHGLCMNDLQWQHDGEADYGARLAADNPAPGITPIHLVYNSGLHIATNGAELADKLATLVDAWPVAVTDIDIIGHSMGGLVARSACAHAESNGHAWLASLRNMIFLGSPHAGAPLEKSGNYVNILLDVSPYTAALSQLAKVRSAGITDLRNGALDETGAKRFTRKAPQHIVPLPKGVKCFAIAATLAAKTTSAEKLAAKTFSAKNAQRIATDAFDTLAGDGLVPIDSALGESKFAGHSLRIPASRKWIAYETNHMQLLHDAAVYRKIRDWLSGKR